MQRHVRCPPLKGPFETKQQWSTRTAHSRHALLKHMNNTTVASTTQRSAIYGVLTPLNNSSQSSTAGSSLQLQILRKHEGTYQPIRPRFHLLERDNSLMGHQRLKELLIQTCSSCVDSLRSAITDVWISTSQVKHEIVDDDWVVVTCMYVRGQNQ